MAYTKIWNTHQLLSCFCRSYDILLLIKNQNGIVVDDLSDDRSLSAFTAVLDCPIIP